MTTARRLLITFPSFSVLTSAAIVVSNLISYLWNTHLSSSRPHTCRDCYLKLSKTVLILFLLTSSSLCFDQDLTDVIVYAMIKLAFVPTAWNLWYFLLPVQDLIFSLSLNTSVLYISNLTQPTIWNYSLIIHLPRWSTSWHIFHLQKSTSSMFANSFGCYLPFLTNIINKP